MNKMSLRIGTSSSTVPQNNLSSRSRFSGRGISISQQELIKNDVMKDKLKKESLPRLGEGKLFYMVSHSSPKLKLTAMT
jgi:hypothetical protein